MANIHTVFDAIVENGVNGAKVRIGVEDKNDYETVRTRLVKLWNAHKELLISIAGPDCDPVLEYSMCGDYDPQESAGYFFLGKPRRKPARSYSFSIVSPNDPPELPAPEAINDGTIISLSVAK